ncbi:MAG: PH domain-containing protein [Actinobacteria bacterium]|nr:PH domain-containing protein [Actinomycetota bacterium]
MNSDLTPPPALDLTGRDGLPATTWRRLNPRMLLVHPIVELVRASPALLGLLIAGSSSGQGSRWGLIAVAVVILAATMRWFTTRYRITERQVELRYGLLRRRSRAAPLDRIRTVDVTAHAMHRVLGLAKVVIGTGTSDRKGHHGLDLDGLDRVAAEQLREELLHRHTFGRPADDAPTRSIPPDREVARLDPGWLRFAPFTMSGAITALATIGFAWRLDNELRLNPARIGPLHDAAEQLRRSPLWVDVLELAAVVAVFVALLSTIGYVLAFWNFRLWQGEFSLHMRRGLITTRATSIELRRLGGVEVSEPITLRAVRGARCLAIATGLRVGRGAERGGTVLLPPAPRAAALATAARVLGHAPHAARLRAHPPAARRRRYLRATIGAILLASALDAIDAFARGPVWVYVVGGVVLVLGWLLAADRYRSLGHALADGYLITRFGSLVRRHSALATSDVIGWNLRRTFFQRRAGLVTLTATTAAGRQRYTVLDLAEPMAIHLAATATPGVLDQFRYPPPGPSGDRTIAIAQRRVE